MNPDMMARSLGLFSIGLGVAEVVAPRRIARSLGMEGKEWLIRLFGAREIATGIGCVSQNPPTPYVWARVAGDVLDIAALLEHRSRWNRKRGNVDAALTAVAGVTLMDLLTGIWLSEGRDGLINRTVRARLEQREQDNEERMRSVQRRGGQFASEIGVGSAGDESRAYSGSTS